MTIKQKTNHIGVNNTPSYIPIKMNTSLWLPKIGFLFSTGREIRNTIGL